MTESTAQLSDLSDELLYRERRVLLEGVADLTRRAALHRLLLEQLELELAAQTRLLSEIEELMDLRPQLRLERLDRQLRGRRLQEVAVEILRSRAAERNRRIMRVFYLNKKRDIGWQLSVTDVQRRLREEFPGFELELAALERSLTTLKDNGDLAAQTNTRDAATPTEWRRRRLLYDITPRGERVEELLAELDAMREEAQRTRELAAADDPQWPATAGRGAGERATERATRIRGPRASHQCGDGAVEGRHRLHQSTAALHRHGQAHLGGVPRPRSVRQARVGAGDLRRSLAIATTANTGSPVRSDSRGCRSARASGDPVETVVGEASGRLVEVGRPERRGQTTSRAMAGDCAACRGPAMSTSATFQTA